MAASKIGPLSTHCGRLKSGSTCPTRLGVTVTKRSWRFPWLGFVLFGLANIVHSVLTYRSAEMAREGRR